MALIIGTIGPVSSSDVIKQMALEGMTIARLNFAHGTFDEHKKIIKKIRKVVNNSVSIMVDLPGPKMRIGKIDGAVHLKKGNQFALTPLKIIGNSQIASVSFNTDILSPGKIVFINDGFIKLEVQSVNNYAICEVKVGGILTSHKGINIPGIDFKTCAFTEYDKKCLKFCADMGVEIVCQSFVNSPQDIACLRMASLSMGYNPLIISKIECSSAVNNIDDILTISDGIMVARGDLGIETPITEIALLQKMLINKAKKYKKISIVATQMLASMIHNPRPTRAESSDVTNAVLDGADYVMLSEETAIGEYPVETVNTMFNIVIAAMKYMLDRY